MPESHWFEEENMEWTPRDKPREEPKDETKQAGAAGDSQTAAKGKQAGEKDL